MNEEVEGSEKVAKALAELVARTEEDVCCVAHPLLEVMCMRNKHHGGPGMR